MERAHKNSRNLKAEPAITSAPARAGEASALDPR